MKDGIFIIIERSVFVSAKCMNAPSGFLLMCLAFRFRNHSRLLFVAWDICLLFGIAIRTPSQCLVIFINDFFFILVAVIYIWGFAFLGGSFSFSHHADLAGGGSDRHPHRPVHGEERRTRCRRPPAQTIPRSTGPGGRRRWRPRGCGRVCAPEQGPWVWEMAEQVHGEQRGWW